jgi:hypothetical protein
LVDVGKPRQDSCFVRERSILPFGLNALQIVYKLEARPPAANVPSSAARGRAKMKLDADWEVAMAHARNIHHQPPVWLQMWHVFALTSTGIGILLLLVLLAALAIYGR